jgi:hypothetical protein
MPRKSKCLKVLNYINTMNDELFYWSVHRSLTGQNDVASSFRSCKLCLQEEDFFSLYEYIIGASVFNPSARMVSAYKKTGSQSCLKAENDFFNNKLSSARIKSEHCIGLIKNRFPCLRV